MLLLVSRKQNLHTPNHTLSGLRKLAFKMNSQVDYSYETMELEAAAKLRLSQSPKFTVEEVGSRMVPSLT